jgi:geranylgeranyl pyrophosphate synthase
MVYSLSASGKRLRPALVLAAYRELGGTGDAVELATAIEVVHTYSLVHDDLPCMDDDDLRLGKMASELYGAAGASGMIGGQVLDLEAEGKTLSRETLTEIHRAKTGALIAASAVIGAMAAEVVPTEVEAVRGYGREIGLAFQIVDDVLDATSSSAQLGKTAGKDAAHHKATYAGVLGVDAAQAAAMTHVTRAVDHLGAVGLDSPLLSELAEFMLQRRS